MKLVTITEATQRLPIRQSNDVIEWVRSTLESVTVYLEAILRTEFTRGTRSDLFKIEGTPFDASEIVPLITSAGFIASAPAPVIVWSDSLEGLASGEALTPIKSRLNEGIFKIEHPAPGSVIYVKIDYTHGFDEIQSGDDKTVAQQDQVPNILKTAALEYAMTLFEWYTESNDSPADRPAPKREVVPSRVRLILEPVMRNGKAVVRPI